MLVLSNWMLSCVWWLVNEGEKLEPEVTAASTTFFHTEAKENISELPPFNLNFSILCERLFRADMTRHVSAKKETYGPSAPCISSSKCFTFEVYVYCSSH